jgi:uncharacterized protein YjbI with pentapeptide repeats
MTLRRPIGRPLIVLAALSVAAGALAFSGGPASADVTDVNCPTVTNGTTGTVSPAPTPGVDWQGCDLAYADLGGADLANANLSQANLLGAQLTNANLTNANLTSAELAVGIFSGTNLTDADLAHADLGGAGFAGADLTHASLAGANLSWATLAGATVTGTNLTGATLAHVSGSALTGTPSSLPAHWVLRYRMLIGPSADLPDASLTGANLVGIDLAGANLPGAHLASANLTGANLSKADLIDADLDKANLTRATIAGANLEGTQTSGIIWSDTTCGNGLNSSLYSNGCNTLQLWGFGGFRSPARKSSLPVSPHEVTVTFRLHFTNGKPVTTSAASWLVSHRLIRATLTGQNIKAVNAFCTWRTAAKEFSCVVKLPKGIKTGKAHPYWITVAENLGHGFRTAPPDRGMANPEYVYFK